MVQASFRRSTAAFISLSCIASFLAPAAAVAATSRSISDIVNASAETVTRGEFLRWSVAVLDIQTQPCTLKYKRVPQSMVGAVCYAQKKNALGIFGPDLNLSQPILRGEALIVLTQISGKTSATTNVSQYTDVKTSSMISAVQNAIGHRWMNPASDKIFGIAKKLSGAEALTTLSAVSGKTPRKGSTETPSVRIKIDIPNTPSTSTSTNGSSTIPETDLLRTVWELIQRDYLRTGNLDQKEAGYAMIEGLVKGLGDPYSNFFRPVAADNFQTQIKGELSGIGAHVEEQHGSIIVIAPLPGSPAEKAGLMPGDILLQANGKDLSGIGIDNAINLIRGQRGTSVTLKVQRGNSDPFTVSIIRDAISIPEIDISWRDNIAIVRIVQFGQTTDSKIRELMAEIQKQNPRGVVLDLRNNPGGLLHAATVVVSNFVPKGSVVAQVKGRTSSTTESTQDDPTINSDVNVVVLVNGGSASASEIVAGALQDHKRAKVVGVKTFGKGTVQELLTFKTGEALKLTIAEWLTPLGRAINTVGVTPDVVVEAEDQQMQRAVVEAR